MELRQTAPRRHPPRTSRVDRLVTGERRRYRAHTWWARRSAARSGLPQSSDWWWLCRRARRCSASRTPATSMRAASALRHRTLRPTRQPAVPATTRALRLRHPAGMVLSRISRPRADRLLRRLRRARLPMGPSLTRVRAPSWRPRRRVGAPAAAPRGSRAPRRSPTSSVTRAAQILVARRTNRSRPLPRAPRSGWALAPAPTSRSDRACHREEAARRNRPPRCRRSHGRRHFGSVAPGRQPPEHVVPARSAPQNRRCRSIPTRSASLVPERAIVRAGTRRRRRPSLRRPTRARVPRARATALRAPAAPRASRRPTRTLPARRGRSRYPSRSCAPTSAR